MVLHDVDNTLGIVQVHRTAPKVWRLVGIYAPAKGII